MNDFTVTIAAEQTSGTGTFTLTPVSDDVDEDNETVSVGGTVTGLTVTAAEVTITDDDERGVTVSPTSADGERRWRRYLYSGSEIEADRRCDGDGECTDRIRTYRWIRTQTSKAIRTP